VQQLPTEDILAIDESPTKQGKAKAWLWTFMATTCTVFALRTTRAATVLQELLTEVFDGVVHCDRATMYWNKGRLQWCWVHLIRDVKFLVEHPKAANRHYGKALLGHLRQLFGIIHRRETFASEASFRRSLMTVRNKLVADAVLCLPPTREAGNLADRFVVPMDSYFRFVAEPGLEPTNNLAEQAIRFVAIHRRLTQGTRGSVGQRWCERIWTAVAICAQQARSVFRFLVDAVQAHFQGTKLPSLLPNTSEHFHHRWLPTSPLPRQALGEEYHCPRSCCAQRSAAGFSVKAYAGSFGHLSNRGPFLCYIDRGQPKSAGGR
jgi:transposase